MRSEPLETIFEKYRTLLYRIAFTHVKSHADAEDMVQEVFVRLMKNRPILKNSEHEKAWFIRTVINLCKDNEKAAWNRKRVALEEVPIRERDYFHIPAVAEDETLWEVLALPGVYRDPIYLFYYEDYSVKEFAAVLGEQENTVKTQMRRGREELRRRLSADRKE